jgi:purine-nucleoside phosphorylase
MTSAGQIVRQAPPPYFMLIDRALRDEGTSYHYLPPAEFVAAEESLVEAAMKALATSAQPICRGTSWTTDAPFRETAPAIAHCRARQVFAVEMEAAGLYAFARARRRPVLCFAHVTNQMAVVEGDFEKGEADGSAASLSVIVAAASAWRDLAAREPGRADEGRSAG